MSGDYANFDLEIVGSPGAYAVHVVASPAGQASAPFVSPFTGTELARFINAVGPPRLTSRRLVPLGDRVSEVQACGSRLAQALFAGEVGTAFRTSLATCAADGSDLRIRLGLVGVPDLDELPWEYLYDGELARFLTLSKKTPVVRVLASADPPPAVTVTPPLRVLVVISSPSGLPPLDVEREERLLRLTTGDLVQSGLVELVVLTDATLTGLQRALLQDFHVFHFMGHGGFDEATQEGVLALEGDDGAHFVTGSRLGTLLHDARTLQLAVLNACEGARTSGRDAFSGVAQALVRQGLPAVVAMQSEISDRAALEFSHQFYWFLSQGLGIEATVCEVRKAMAVSDEASEWGTPVLLRSETGQPFSVIRPEPAHRASAAAAGVEPALAPTATDGRITALYEAALTALAAQRQDIARPLLEQVAVERPGYRDVARLLHELDASAPGVTETGTTASRPTSDQAAEATAAPAADTAPAAPPTLSDRMRRALLVAGTPRPREGRPWYRKWLIGLGVIVAIALAVVGVIAYWLIRTGPYADACGESITSSGGVARPVNVACALDAPSIDGAFEDWKVRASHPIPAGAGEGTAGAQRASWKAQWDNTGLYVYAKVQDSTRGVDAVTDAAAYALVDGVTVLFGSDARRLQSAETARAGDVAVTLATTARGVSVGRATGSDLTRYSEAPEVLAQVIRGVDGYVLEARIPWETLNLPKVPKANSVVALCVLATDGGADSASPTTVAGCPDWTKERGLHPGSWQDAILSLDE